MQHVFIIGSKGIPAKYGGFETFVDKLTEYRKSENIKYHVACMSSDAIEFEYNSARCFNVAVPDIGPAKAVYYDIAALKASLKYIKVNHIENAIVYILACRIGPFIGHYNKKLLKSGGRLYVNPDGHEWKRDKWNWAIKKYWKHSEKLMVKHADLLICDSKAIEKYISEEYKQYEPDTTYISYGADVTESKLKDDDLTLLSWYKNNSISPQEYYLVVGRFVPENNYETMITEFMKSDTKKNLVLITKIDNNNFYERLKKNTKFNEDPRIKFVGTVYNQELLKKIREYAFGYIHGHEVGGTNPSLLESLCNTDLNLLIDIGFNREVAEDSALYWEKTNGNLAVLINYADQLSKQKIDEFEEKAKRRITDYYNWTDIVGAYEQVFSYKSRLTGV